MQTNPSQQIKNHQHIEDFFATTLSAIGNLVDDPFLRLTISSSAEVISQMISSGIGKVITTGLGKAGHVAEKAASSFSSLGVPACYLHPAQASHGDVGIVQKNDIMIAFSNSGKTREVIEAVELSRRLGISKVIAITAKNDSPIASLSDITIAIGDIKEAGYLSLAPTTSVMIMIMVSDIIATLCAKTIGLTINDFGLRHHGGYLGRKCRGEEP